MDPAAVKKLTRASRSIHGWFFAEGLFALLDESQLSAGIRGDLFEIGAHHGKSTVLLGNMAQPRETVGICDIFGSQDQNISGSGAGDRVILETNMRRFAPSAKTQIFECLSSSLDVAQLGRYRFFHIDGGHLAEEAIGDLVLGDSVVVDGGLMVVDDPYRPEWPGVTEAILTFIAQHPGWVTVTVGFNKHVLARLDHADRYQQALRDDRAWAYLDRRMYSRKTMPIAGRGAEIFFVPSYLQSQTAEIAVARGRWLTGAVRSRLGR